MQQLSQSREDKALLGRYMILYMGIAGVDKHGGQLTVVGLVPVGQPPLVPKHTKKITE